MSKLFSSGSRSIGALTSVLPLNIQGWFPLGLTGLISLLSKGSEESSPTPQFKSIHSSALSFLYGSTLTSIYDYWKTIVFTGCTFVSKVMSLLFNMLSRLVTAFLSRSRWFFFFFLISWLLSPSAVLLEPKKIKSVTVSIVSPSISMKWRDWMPWSWFFECWVLS